jgi:Tol biopolymer transport system component
LPYDASLPNNATRTNGPSQIYLADAQTGVTRLISAATDGLTPANGNSEAAWSSADGRFVALTAFPSGSYDLTNHMQLYLHDTHRGTRDLRSRGLDGQLARGHPGLPSLAGDGSRLLFVSAAADLVPDDPNALADVFVETIATRERRRIRTSAVPANAPALPEAVPHRVQGGSGRCGLATGAWRVHGGSAGGRGHHRRRATLLPRN